MHESSTAGGEDEAPREDGLKKAAEEPSGQHADGVASDAAGGAPGRTDDAPPARRVPERSQAEQDEIFAALIAQFDDPVDLNDPDWPEIENLRARGESKGDFKGGGFRGGADVSDLAPQPRPRPPAGPRDFEVAEDPDEGHFVPPEPPPLPEADATAKFAWLAVLGGPALLLFDAVVWQEVAGWPAWVGVTAFLGGFVTLVVRMKERDEDEPPDPHGGAVV
ncbi:hypothetical protein [Kitasatospora sp. NBC_00315]|uniref:hypothetical protein n=1 Tax=Kitasatospora sp. NBC_00315 TaxID=2975963 RepID=UPI003255F00A